MLFSGGFDSTLQANIIQPDILLYVDMNSQYASIEKKVLPTTSLPHFLKKRIIVTNTIDLSAYEEETTQYIPFRNIMLILLAMQHGQHIYLGFNEGDNAPDKDEYFIQSTTEYLKHFLGKKYRPEHWSSSNFKIEAPFRHNTKTEMVAQYLNDFDNSNKTKKYISSIRSCYHSTSVKGCGMCSPCVSKAVALINNGISIDGVYDTPITLTTLKEYLGYQKIYRKNSRTYVDYKQAIITLRQTKG